MDFVDRFGEKSYGTALGMAAVLHMVHRNGLAVAIPRAHPIQHSLELFNGVTVGIAPEYQVQLDVEGNQDVMLGVREVISFPTRLVVGALLRHNDYLNACTENIET